MTKHDELNKKLAEWAGFHKKRKRGIRVGFKRYARRVVWCYPDGFTILGKWHFPVNALPNFTSSLDACFKWLVPELQKTILLVDINFCMPYNEEESFLCTIIDDSCGEHLVAQEAETPALALCKAIERLIDKERDDSKIS